MKIGAVRGGKAAKAGRSTTIADAAKLAGVGKVTVSRRLSGSANVSEDTAERVQCAIGMLNHQPNELARSRIDAPERIAPAGFYDFDFADVLQPALTVVRQPVYRVGEMGANLLFQRIVRGESSRSRVSRA